MFDKVDIETIAVRTAAELSSVDRLVLPGGESTTMLTLIDRSKLWEPLLEFGRSKPVWGICAGAILIAREVENPKQRSLGFIDIRAHRNHYGSQLESFSTNLTVAGLDDAPLQVDFIRAPLLSALPDASGLEVRAYHDTTPVLFQQGKVMACSFHTELGSDSRLHEYFAQL